MKHQIVTAIKAILFFTILTGVAYPLLITGIVQLAFRQKANGSIVFQKGKPIGSTLIGQSFTSEKYFWPRPSAVSYNPELSGATNLGPTSSKLRQQIEQRRKDFIQRNYLPQNTVVPAEMVTCSASGLDPHISPEAAMLQLDRVAKARGLNSRQRGEVEEIIHQLSLEKSELALGDARVNVFELNLRINQLQ